MESLSRGGFGLLLATVFAIFIAQPAEAGRPDFEDSKPGNVNCNGKALGHDKNSPRGKAHGRGDDCDVVENTAPVANAGEDAEAQAGDLVVLDGSASSDADGDSLSYQWTQTAGEPVQLSSATAIMPEFTAPALPQDESLQFQLEVNDGNGGSDTDVVTVHVAEGLVPTGEIVNGNVLGIRETIVIEFSESMEPASLEIAGDFADYKPQATWTQRNVPNDTVKIAADWAWEAGDRQLLVDANDTNGNAVATLSQVFDVDLAFENFQAAEIVLGQLDFSSVDSISSNDQHAHIGRTYGNTAYSRAHDTLFVPVGGHMLAFFGIPTTNGEAADFFFNGGTDGAVFRQPRTTIVHGEKLVVAEHYSRVDIFAPIPQDSVATIEAVVGQDDRTSRLSGCAADRMTYSFGASVTPDGKLLVTDRDNHRVLVWNSLPTTDGVPADMVLGQQGFTSCASNDRDGDGASDLPSASTLATPRGVWSDGEKLVIADNDNNRLLVWNTFPTTNGQAADLVIGQDDFNSVERQFGTDAHLDGRFVLTFWSDGDQLIVGDAVKNRVLVWNEFPTTNNEPADVVLGQSAFDMAAENDDDQDGTPDNFPSARTFNLPTSVSVAGDRLFVRDLRNHRVLVFRSR